MVINFIFIQPLNDMNCRYLHLGIVLFQTIYLNLSDIVIKTQSGKLALEAGGDPNIKGCNGRTALMEAAYANAPEAVEMFLKAGANTEIRDDDGNTALIIAARANSPIAAQLLLRAGASVNAVNNAGQTALTAASKTASQKFIRIILQGGAA